MASPPKRPEADDLIALVERVGAFVFAVDAVTLQVRPLGRPPNLLGLKPEVPLPFDAFFAALPGAARSELYEQLQGVLAGANPNVLELPVVLPDGGEAWLRTSLRVAGDGAIWGVMLDITNERENERQWHETESWLVTLGETLPFDFWICDTQGRYVLQNPASRQRLGNRLGLEAHDAEGAARFTRALEGETVRDERESGGRHMVHVWSQVHDGDVVRGVLGVDIDITELKEAEARLRESLAELRQTQDALVRRRELAALGEMSAVVAHEVRNPLGSIANALALLRKRSSLSDVDQELCRVIEDEVNRLDSLVANLLVFVRPMRAKLGPQVLGEVVNEALTQAMRTAEGAGSIDVRCVVDEAMPPVSLDTQLFGVALTNVIRNAVQAMPSGGALSVKVDREHGWARVSIEDNGPGIPPELKSRIFEPFISGRPAGNGLGLAIVRRVIEEHSGELELRSEPGEGTVFVLRLPLSLEPV